MTTGGVRVVGDEAHDGSTDLERHVALVDGDPAQHPFERGPAAGDHDEFVVAVDRFVVGDRVGEVLPERHLRRAGLDQCLEHVGLARREDRAQPGEEGVAVADLWCAASHPVERLVGGRRHRRGITLEHLHLMAESTQLQRGRQPCDAATHHCDLHRAQTRWADPVACRVRRIEQGGGTRCRCMRRMSRRGSGPGASAGRRPSSRRRNRPPIRAGRTPTARRPGRMPGRSQSKPIAATAARLVVTNPTDWAKRLGGPGTSTGWPRRGAITRVANCPSGLNFGPAMTRRRKPIASTTIIHSARVARVIAASAATNPATTRAAFSFTGFGNAICTVCQRRARFPTMSVDFAIRRSVRWSEMERVRGIEPLLTVWKTVVLAVELHPRGGHTIPLGDPNGHGTNEPASCHIGVWPRCDNSAPGEQTQGGDARNERVRRTPCGDEAIETPQRVRA